MCVCVDLAHGLDAVAPALDDALTELECERRVAVQAAVKLAAVVQRPGVVHRHLRAHGRPLIPAGRKERERIQNIIKAED